jgi:hypothetical protein
VTKKPLAPLPQPLPLLGYTLKGKTVHIFGTDKDPSVDDYTKLQWHLSVCGCEILSLDELERAIADLASSRSAGRYSNENLVRYLSEAFKCIVESHEQMRPCTQCRYSVSIGRRYRPAFREVSPEERRNVRSELEDMARQLGGDAGLERHVLGDLRTEAAAARRRHLELVAQADVLAVQVVDRHGVERSSGLLGIPVHELRAAVMRQWQRDRGVAPVVH